MKIIVSNMKIIYFIEKLNDTNKYLTAPYADKNVDHILVKFQITIFSHMNTTDS